MSTRLTNNGGCDDSGSLDQSYDDLLSKRWSGLRRASARDVRSLGFWRSGRLSAIGDPKLRDLATLCLIQYRDSPATRLIDRVGFDS